MTIRARSAITVACLLLGLVVAAPIASGQSPEPVPTAAPSASAGSSFEPCLPSASPTPSNIPAPPVASTGDPSPSPTAAHPTSAITVVRAVLRSWERDGRAVTQVIAEIRNDSCDAVEVRGPGTTYTIAPVDGSAPTEGAFSHAFPAVLDPGASSYLVAELVSAQLDPDGEVLAVTVFATPPAHPALPASVHRVRLRDDAATGLLISGGVRNDGTDQLTFVTVGTVLLGARDDILGVGLVTLVYLDPGDVSRWYAYDGPDIKRARVRRIVASASDGLR